MSGETSITIVGNLTTDPELRFTASGAPLVSFTIASTPRTYKNGAWEDGDTLFMQCTAWRRLAENVAESMSKGHRVIATGAIRQRSYDTKQGEKRTVMEMDVTDIGHSLMFVTSTIRRADGPKKSEPKPARSDPWADNGTTDDPPF